MSADQNLSPDQFYPMHKLLGMHSRDAEDYQRLGRAYGDRHAPYTAVKGTTVADAMPVVHHDLGQGDYHELHQAMARAGHQRWNEDEIPVEVGRDEQHGTTLEDGHHRVAIAHSLGWPGLRGMSSETSVDNAVAAYHANRAAR